MRWARIVDIKARTAIPLIGHGVGSPPMVAVLPNRAIDIELLKDTRIPFGLVDSASRS